MDAICHAVGSGSFGDLKEARNFPTSRDPKCGDGDADVKRCFGADFTPTDLGFWCSCCLWPFLNFSSHSALQQWSLIS